MSWFSRWFGRDKAASAQPAAAAQGQIRMTLEERMAFRREMVFESVREVMLAHGMLSSGYRLNVARMDSRGHVYAAMIDLAPSGPGRSIESQGELHAIESRIAHTAKSRYRVKVISVYWRFDLTEAPRAATEAALRREAVPPVPAPAPAPSGGRFPFFSNAGFGSTPDDFPDTLVEDRSAKGDRVSPEELAAFEQALAQGMTAEPVQLGRRTYQTNYAPLE